MEVTDLGPTQLKNIERSIRAYSLEVGKPAQAKPAKATAPSQRSLAALLAAGVVALIVIAGGAWYFLSANRAPPAAHLSIVVLPFTNLSNDPSQDYFADGITENLTTDLSRIRNSFVIARNTAFTFKGKNIPVKEISMIKANSLFWRLTKAETEAAIAILKQAVERYPDYGPAHSMLAFVLLISGYVGWSQMEPQLQLAGRLAPRAAELDDSDPWAHLALGYVAFVRRRTNVAAAEFRRALDLNPNFAAAHGYLGWTLAFDGQSDEAMTHLEEAIRMSPHDPQNAIFNTGLAAVHYLEGRYAKAVEYSSKSLQQRSAFTAGNRIHVASLAQNGQIDEARGALARLKEMHPDLSIAWIERNVPYTAGPMAKFLEGMRKAGLQ
jgi:Tfp pilus assembly protein PilF